MTYSPKSISLIPETPGIYQYYDLNGEILYVGKAINLRRRVSSYFQKSDHDIKTQYLISQIKTIKVIQVQSEFEALVLEAKLISTQKPKYNLIAKDDRQYIYLKITNDIFPKIIISRRVDGLGEKVYGPFPSKQVLLHILSSVRSIIPYCTQKKIGKKACFYTHLGLCCPCPNTITQLKGQRYTEEKKVYKKNIRQLMFLFSGKISLVRNHIEREMKQYSSKQFYEQASVCRDRLKKLDFLLEKFHPAASYIDDPLLAKKNWEAQTSDLALVLQPYFSSIHCSHIECYDISNISGKFATASMVTFIDGEQVLSKYRKFRIRLLESPNDFEMLKETIYRRFKHSEWKKPDLIVIDGGTPQLMTLARLQIPIPMIGIAKHEEELVVPFHNDYIKIKLYPSSGALRLVKRMRDEAHRFAHRYHEKLRLKYLFSAFEK